MNRSTLDCIYCWKENVELDLVNKKLHKIQQLSLVTEGTRAANLSVVLVFTNLTLGFVSSV